MQGECMVPKAGPRHNDYAPGLSEGESAAVSRMLVPDQESVAD